MPMKRAAFAMTAILGLAACATPQFGRGVAPATTSDERIAFLTSELRQRPGDVSLLNGIGAEYVRQGYWPQAAGAFREVLLVNPANRDALVGFGKAQAALGSYGDALSHADRAGASAEARNLRGIALTGLRRFAEAATTFEDAFAANPRDLDTRNNLALSLALAGNAEGYNVAKGVAFAPGSDVRHHRNFYLVAAMLGRESEARREGASLGVDDGTIEGITRIGRQARAEGVAAFGMARSL